MTQTQTMEWTPLRQLTPGTAWTNLKHGTGRVFRPGRPHEKVGVVAASVERHSRGDGGRYYHLQVLSYRLTPAGTIDTESQRVVESGIESTLRAARQRAEAALQRGMTELRVAALQENAELAAELRAEVARLRTWKRDDSGHCRHGQYVGGSGVDWMCGTCESMSLYEELAELETQAAALELAR